MDRVRSSAMDSSRGPGNQPRILSLGPPPRQSRRARKCPSGKEKSDAEALAAAALAADVGIAETEGLVEALADEIDLGAVDELEAVGIDEHADALAVEDTVA